MADYNLKFIFANHDGTSVLLKATGSSKVGSLKTQLLEEWPENLETPDDVAGFKLICMGRGILKDNMTLTDCKIPQFAHPTPVNVAIMPKGYKTKVEPEKPTKTGVTEVAEGCCVLM